MDLGEHFLRIAEETFQELSKKELNLEDLLTIQASVIKSLADSSLIFFSQEKDEKVLRAFSDFKDVLDLLRERNAFLGGELLQLNMLKNIDLEKGFSLDRRFGIPKEILVWANRIIKPRLFIVSKNRDYKYFKDPMFSLGVDIEPTDRLFPYLVRSVRRIIEETGAPFRVVAELMKWELFLGDVKDPPRCFDGYVEVIRKLPRVFENALEYRLSKDVVIYEVPEYPFGSAKEVIGFSTKKKIGFIARRW
ncbi:hypothetical protein [Pyrococcus sp. ST04]|uniref:hypothetical protein n=1 Tax=Pyrococcus sp. ST04 TaxID=1183377 RepID=UPI0002605A71|nr:hypothetical protein [Pyrococcus sp. ST04]AFK22050.1 hypothetical protein Py04_0448 [Pyrococcus sp. ST04]